jgi:Ca2+-binding RTX toxin-like protein
MKRVVLLLGLMGVTVALAASAAFAITDYGTTGDDILLGTDDGDYLYGLPGDDAIRGFGGIDHLYGGADNDTVRGGAEIDVMFLGAGKDEGYGGTGGDEITGGPGADTIIAGRGDDTDYAHDRVEGYDFVLCGPGDGDLRIYVDSLDEYDQTTCEDFHTEPPA